MNLTSLNTFRTCRGAIGSRNRTGVGQLHNSLEAPIHALQHRTVRIGSLHSNPRLAKVLTAAAAFDSDDYELEATDGYDSDDYEILERAAAAPRSLSRTSPAAAGPPSVSYAADDLSQPYFQQAGTASSGPRKTKGTRQAISSGFNIFLLFGAAIDRFVWRLQAAGLGALALLGRGAGAVSKKARKTFHSSPAGRKVDQLQRSISDMQQELPDDTWGKLLWLWDRPPVQRLRLTVSMFNLSFRLPALMALVATQVGLLASQVSLPMLAPLLLGTGMLLRSIKTNASFLFPRIGLVVVMLWLLWFANSVIQNTTAYLRKQGAIDNRLAAGVITVSEVSGLLVALVVLLSMLGVNVSALLLPAGIAVAIAAKDLSHNFLAGFFLFVVQPFKLGDRLAVSSAAPGLGGGGSMGSPAGWFEGVCEKVDLRYTIVRQGRRRLMIPNSAFLTREFMVLDDGPMGDVPPPPPPPATSSSDQQYPQHAQQFMTNDNRHIWAYVQGPPVHQELAMQMQQGPPMPPPPPPPQQQPPHQHQHHQQQPGDGEISSQVQQENSEEGAPTPAPPGPTSPPPAFTNVIMGSPPQPVAYGPGHYATGPAGQGPPPPGGNVYYQSTGGAPTTYNSMYGQPIIGVPSPGQWQANTNWQGYQGGGAGLRSHPLGPDAWQQGGGGGASPTDK